MIKEIIAKLDAYFSSDELKIIDSLNEEISSQQSIISNRDKEISELKQQISSLNEGWSNPYTWSTHKSTYESIEGLRIPPNTFINVNDREIKKAVISLKKDSFEETVKEVEKFVSQRIQYFYDDKNSYHPGFKEYFQTSSFTYHARVGDCDDQAILMAAILHMLGYGDKVVVCTGIVNWNNSELGHAWIKCFINDEWINYDSNALQSKAIVEYPELKDCWMFWNYYNVYKI